MSNDALTFTLNKGAENVNGKLLEKYADVTLSNSYPIGGYTFPYALSTQYGQLGIASLLGSEQVAVNTASFNYFAVWNSQTGKLMIISNATGLEVPDATDLSTLVMTLKLTGTR
jgi:hypothetical protein